MMFDFYMELPHLVVLFHFFIIVNVRGKTDGGWGPGNEGKIWGPGNEANTR